MIGAEHGPRVFVTFYVGGGADENRKVTDWHEKSGGQHVMQLDFAFLLPFCSF